MVGASGHWNLPPFSRPGAPDGFRLAARDPRLANRAHMHARGLPLRLELAQRACPPTIGGEYEVFGALGKAPPCQTEYDGRTIDRRARWSWGPKLPFRVTLSQLLPGRIGFPKIGVSASALTHPASASGRTKRTRSRPEALVLLRVAGRGSSACPCVSYSEGKQRHNLTRYPCRHPFLPACAQASPWSPHPA